jgi:predicted PurR-regulated permease PerM
VTIRRADIAFFFAMLVGLYVAWLALDVLLLVYVSALFAVVLTPVMEAVESWHIGSWRPGRALSITIIIVAGLALMTLFFAFALPPMFRDLEALASGWPQRSAEIGEALRRIPVLRDISITTLERPFAGIAGGVVDLFKQVASMVFWIFTWLILTAYFIADGRRAFDWVLSLFPVSERGRLEQTLYRCEARVRNWLVGQGALMLIYGCASAVIFGLLRVKYFLVLAVFAGIGNIVPVVGPLAAVVLASVVAGFDSWPKLLGVLIFYFVYAQVEHAYLTPRIMRSTLDLPPLAVIIALTTGGVLAGVLGALIALPTAAILAVFAEEYLIKPRRRSALMPETAAQAVEAAAAAGEGDRS